jgi:hypothetical protein
MVAKGERQYVITKGPEIWGLIVGLFIRNRANPTPVRFTVADDYATEWEVNITSVQARNESGDQWNIEGVASKCAIPGQQGSRETFELTTRRVFIFYDTTHHAGYLKFLT